MIIIKHREDKLLQKNVERGCPSHLKETYVGRVSIPTHNVLLMFLEKELIGKHESEEELEKILNTWPEFAEKKGLNLDKDWRGIHITERKTIIVLPAGLEIALIH